jgi:hypothetical protein
VFYEDETNPPLEKGILDGTMSGDGGSRRVTEDGPERAGEKVAIVTAAGSGMVPLAPESWRAGVTRWR